MPGQIVDIRDFLSKVVRALGALRTEVVDVWLEGEEDVAAHPLYDGLDRCTNTLGGVLSILEKRISLVNARAVVGNSDPRYIDYLTSRVYADSATRGLLQDSQFEEWAKEYHTKFQGAYINALAKDQGQAKARGAGNGRGKNSNKKPGKVASAKKATDKAKDQDKGKAKADKSE